MRVHVPATLDEALALLEQYPEACPLAGGTDLLVQVRDGVKALRDVLVLEYLDDMRGIREDRGTLVIGAATSMAEIARAPLVRRRAPILARAASLMGSPQIRERATIGGNVANASPAADSVPALVAMGARLVLASPKGRRELRVEDFFVGPGATRREPGELLERLLVPVEEAVGFFVKLGLRRAVTIAQVSAALWGRFERSRFAWCRIALGAVAPTVIRATGAEELLASESLTLDLLRRVADQAAAAAEPVEDIRGTAEYRTAMVSALLQDGFQEMRLVP